MKLFFGIFFLLIIITIGVQGAAKIEIYEIRDNDNGLQLKNLNPKNIQKPDPLLKLLRDPKSEKPEKNVVKFAKNLIKKLKSLRGEEKTNRFNDDTHIYILNSDFDDDSSNEETLFIDKTRNDRAVTNIDKNDIRDLLLQLLQPERKIPSQRQRKLRQEQVMTLRKRPKILRNGDDSAQGHVKIVQRRAKHAYEYDDYNNGENNIDRDDQ